MSKFEKKAYENIDITRSELKEIGDCLKKEEFRKLLTEYFEEVNDPKNKAIYEKEFIQFEKERGVDVTFIHPTPGYVIKTSVDGEEKAFINICTNDKVEKPILTRGLESGQVGTNCSIPHMLIPPKIDLDKKHQSCIVFDVVFHPDTLKLATINKDFKNFVNNTALSGIEDTFKTVLDRNNLKFPKINYKGSKNASIVRTKNTDLSTGEPSFPIEVPNYPYKPVDEVTNSRVTEIRDKSSSPYTLPRHVIKQRKGIDFKEFSNAVDAKVNAATPSELVVEIDLPLLNSTQDALLDVSERNLSLISEKPSKYKLNISLPYAVDEANGTARFDQTTKKLIVTLPVIQKKYEESFFSRDDSGIESDPNQNRSSSDEDLSVPAVEVISSSENSELQNEKNCVFRTSEVVSPIFLSEDKHYMFPNYSLVNENMCFSITLDVKNVDPTTVCHHFILEGTCVQFKFSSLGSGFFPLNYAFCMQFPKCEINPSTLKVDVWDNNLIVTLDLISCKENLIPSYFAGPTVEKLQEVFLPNPLNFKDCNLSEKFDDLHQNSVNEKIKDNHSMVVTELPKVCKRMTTVSISSEVFTRRSILKTSRSLSESNTDDYATWSSLDLSDNPDESLNGSTVKKTVRFSDVISKKIFRANSSILGQKHKNEKKSRNRKKMAIRKRLGSESEASEVSDFSDYSEVSDMSSENSDGGASSDDSSTPLNQPTQLPSSKKHRRRGSKNSRKNAATAKQNSFLHGQD